MHWRKAPIFFYPPLQVITARKQAFSAKRANSIRSKLFPYRVKKTMPGGAPWWIGITISGIEFHLVRTSATSSGLITPSRSLSGACNSQVRRGAWRHGTAILDGTTPRAEQTCKKSSQIADFSYCRLCGLNATWYEMILDDRETED